VLDGYDDEDLRDVRSFVDNRGGSLARIKDEGSFIHSFFHSSVLGLRDHLLPLPLEDDARKATKHTERRGEEEKDDKVKVSSCRRNRRNPSRSGRR